MATHEPAGEIPGDLEPTPPPPVAPRPSSMVNRSAWILAIVAGIIAGAGTWLTTEGVLKSYAPWFKPASAPYPSAEDMKSILHARIISSTIILGAMGGLFGLVFGLAGGAARKSISAGLMAGGLGLILGALIETGLARVVVDRVYTNLDPNADDLLLPLLVHVGLWSVPGAVGGLAFGLGIGGRLRWARTAIGAAIGAALGTVAFELLGAVAFPTHGTHLPVPDAPSITSLTRALAPVLVALGTAIGSVLGAGEPKRKP